MNRPTRAMSIILLGFIAGFCACDRRVGERDAMYEEAIRFFVNERSIRSDTLVVIIDRRAPSAEVLSGLSDLDLTFLGRDAVAEDPEAAPADEYSELSLRWKRRKGLDTAIIQISMFNPPYEAFGADYYLQCEDGLWKVIDKGVEWTTSIIRNGEPFSGFAAAF